MKNRENKEDLDNQADVPSLDPVLDTMVGEKLRNYFDTMLEAQIPDRIVELILKLGAGENTETGGKSK